MTPNVNPQVSDHKISVKSKLEMVNNIYYLIIQLYRLKIIKFPNVPLDLYNNTKLTNW